MKTTFKKLMIVLVTMLASIQAFAVKHVVEKGETIESIAQKYGTTAQAIIQANPDAESFIYVGMELNIPETAGTNYVQTPVQNQTQASSTFTYTPSGNQTQQNYQSFSEGPGWTAWMYGMYGFLPKPEGTKASGSTFGVCIGGNYWMNKNSESNTDGGKGFFAGAGIGWNWAYWDLKHGDNLTAHFIRVPLHLGYAITTENKNFAIVPTAGLGIDFCVSAKMELDDVKVKIKKKVGLEAKFGTSIRLGGFDLMAFYNIPLSDDTEMYYGDDGYFSVGFGWGF